MRGEKGRKGEENVLWDAECTRTWIKGKASENGVHVSELVVSMLDIHL